MSIFHNSTRVNRLPEVRDTATAGLRSNRFKASIIEKWLCVVLCLVFVFSALGVAVPQATHAAEEGYLLDRMITWADGTTERVQIGNDGFFRINGEKKKLIGIVLSTQVLPTGYWGQFYLPGNMAMYEKELVYLQSIGVRLISLDLPYIKWVSWGLSTFAEEQKAYKDLLDLLYRHKMLVIPLICGHGMPDFGSLQVLDFPINKGTDSMGQWATRWIDIVSRYENVVSITAENELDIKEHPSNHLDSPNFKDQAYTATEVAAYMTFLTGILRTKFNGPIISKLTTWYLDEPEIKKTCLNATDLGAFDCYAYYKENMDSRLTVLQTWLSSSGYPTTGWWCMELNALRENRQNIDSAYVNTGFIESVFNNGARIAILWTSNRTTMPDAQFFNNDGSPISKLVELAADFDRLQAPISEPATTPTDTYTITATAGAHGSISPTGNVVINQGGNQTFTITPDVGYHVADVLVDGASVGAVASYNFANVTADHTISASFTQNQYTLTVDVTGSGSVPKVPNQATYPSGTPVQLTATADPGWSFSGWSGDLTGSANPATIAVDGNKTVTATFTIKNLSPTVTIKLVDSAGNGLSGGVIEYYSNGWKTIGTTPSNGELAYNFPETLGTYNFRLSYAGASQSKSQNIATNPVVVFQTSKVTMKLLDSANNELPGGGTQYYAGNWKTFGSGNATAYMELLPLTYNFRLSYAGASQSKSQNIATNPNVVFQTSKVTMKLLDSANNELPGGSTQYYAGGWKTFGSGNATAYMELLPLTYNFRLSYAGASQDKSQNITTNPVVVFQTGTVHSDSGSCTYYYAGGWKTFSQELQLLPGTYNFRFKDGTADKNYGILANTVNHIR